MAVPSSPKWLNKVITDYSTVNYRIEFRRFLSNHILQGIVAIAHLGGTEERTREFAAWYVKEKPLEKPLKEDPARSEFGKVAEEKPNFGDLMDHYKALVTSEGSIGEVIKKEFPWLGKGSVSALFHGLIQLGYGAGSQSETMMLEGLSYLHWSYEPIPYDEKKDDIDIKKFGHGTSNIISILEELQENRDLIDRVSSFIDKEDSHGVLQSRFLGCIQHLGDFFIKLANSAALPPGAFDPDNPNKESVHILATWLVVQVLTVFSMSERINDFVILHGVTASWSLRQIVPYLTPHDAVVAIRDLLALVFAAYVVERCSPLSRELMVLNKPLDDSVWEGIKVETLAKVGDEHVYKLVQVCHDLWTHDNLRSENTDPILYSAVRTVLDNDFSFVKKNSYD